MQAKRDALMCRAKAFYTRKKAEYSVIARNIIIRESASFFTDEFRQLRENVQEIIKIITKECSELNSSNYTGFHSSKINYYVIFNTVYGKELTRSIIINDDDPVDDICQPWRIDIDRCGIIAVSSEYINYQEFENELDYIKLYTTPNCYNIMSFKNNKVIKLLTNDIKIKIHNGKLKTLKCTYNGTKIRFSNWGIILEHKPFNRDCSGITSVDCSDIISVDCSGSLYYNDSKLRSITLIENNDIIRYEFKIKTCIHTILDNTLNIINNIVGPSQVTLDISTGDEVDRIYKIDGKDSDSLTNNKLINNELINILNRDVASIVIQYLN